MLTRLRHVLGTQHTQNSIRVGDVFALLIEFYYAKRNMEQAYHLIRNMRERNIILRCVLRGIPLPIPLPLSHTSLCSFLLWWPQPLPGLGHD